MPDKKKSQRTYDADVMALPPLRMVLGDVPDPDANSPRRRGSKMDQKMESAVQKLVKYLKEEKI